jgi:hypothetical protein
MVSVLTGSADRMVRMACVTGPPEPRSALKRGVEGKRGRSPPRTSGVRWWIAMNSTPGAVGGQARAVVQTPLRAVLFYNIIKS